MQCGACGATNPEGSGFCVSCGRNLVAGYPPPPPPPGYAAPAHPPQPYQQPMAMPPGYPPPVQNDPHGFAPSVNRLGTGAKRAGKVAFAIACALAEEGEVVECVLQGRFLDADGALVLTNKRLLFVNDKQWKPDVHSVAITSAVTVQGWQDDRTAALVVHDAGAGAGAAGVPLTIDRIPDRPLAQEMAGRIRARVAAGG